MNSNSATLPDGENISSLVRSSGTKRKAESEDEGLTSKKLKLAAAQKYCVQTSTHAHVPLKNQVSDLQESKPIEKEYVALNQPKISPVLLKTIRESVSPPPIEAIPSFDKSISATKEQILSTPDNATTSATGGKRILEPHLKTPPSTTTTTSYIPKINTTRISPRALCPPSQDETSALYGEMVHVLTGLGVIPTIGYQLYQMDVGDPKRAVAAFVYSTLMLGPFMATLAIVMKNIWFSRLAMFGGLAFSVSSNLTEWPHEGECTITALCHGGLLMCVMANVSLSLKEKIIRLFLFFAVGSFVSIQSPYSVYWDDTFPMLGVTTLMCIFFLYIGHNGIVGNLATVQGARLILGALFVQHAVYSATTTDQSAYESIVSLVKGAFVVSVGIAAAGTVQDEILQKESLEVLVRNRTKKLYMVNLALQASETAIAITDNMGCIIWVNAEFERISGRNEEGLLGLILKDVIYNLDTASTENKYLLMESYDDPSKRSERELQIGESVFHLEATPFSSEGYGKDRLARNDRFLMVFKDITAGHDRDLAEKKAEHEAAVAKAMSESMVTLTHELRTPLQGIMGVTSLLLQQANDFSNDVKESLRSIMGSSTLLLNLINNLLDVKKANAKMMEDFELAAIPAPDQIKDAIFFCKPLAFISNVNIVADLKTDKKLCVRSNALRLQQVLINLISNAIKYTKRGSDINIRIHATTRGDAKKMIDNAIASSDNVNSEEGHDDESDVLVISISDCGPGIASDEAGRLFQRYAQLESRPTRVLGGNVIGQPSGTGVGLHLCQLFVDRMNGQIWTTNNRNGLDGCTFSFYLPLVSCDANYSVPKSKAAICASGKRSNSSEKEGEKKSSKASVFDCRVLLVDDTLINRKVFDRMLKKLGISYSFTVNSGEKALQELARNSYDLVITDLQMPGMSGTELSAAIRDSSNGTTAPIVVGLTADIRRDTLKRCVESGMADVLYKPITLTEMKEYFETTVPRLKPGVWYKATIGSYNSSSSSDDSSVDGTIGDEEQNTQGNAKSSSIHAQ